MRETLRELLFPSKCILCRRILRGGGMTVCPDCLRRLCRLDARRTGDWFRYCWTPMSYEGSVREALHRFKFGDMPGYAAPLGEILARCIQDRLDGDYDLISWVPVSERRRRERGYDQAGLLAAAAAERLGAPLASTLEKRTHTAAQSGLSSAEDRRKNVRNVYAVPDPAGVAGRRILLIDDIITTGSTLDEASRTLLEADAATVVAAALAQPV